MSDTIDGDYQTSAAVRMTQPGTSVVAAEPNVGHAVALAHTASPDEAREMMQRYQEVCEAVLTDDDYQTFEQYDRNLKRKVKKKFKKKSAVKKLQTFWGVSVHVRETQRDDLGEGHFGFRCVAAASMPNGRVVESTGACSTFEERFDVSRYDDESEARFAGRCKAARARSYHDVLSTAETRATNRAVMNCIGVGGGEVTADEIRREPTQRREQPAREDAPTPAPQPEKTAEQKHPDVEDRLSALYQRWAKHNDGTRIDFADAMKALGLTKFGEIDAAVAEMERAANARPAEVPAASDEPNNETPTALTARLKARMMALFSELKFDGVARHDLQKMLTGKESSRDFDDEDYRKVYHELRVIKENAA